MYAEGMNKDFLVNLTWQKPESAVALVTGAALAVAGLYLLGVRVEGVS